MTKQEQGFVQTVWRTYQQTGRYNLPWRQPSHLRPYTILVSELMLQQTQVARVIPKYRAFLRCFPSARALAKAPLGEVLTQWQGLGYNRRAKYLQEAVRLLYRSSSRRWPRSYTGLTTLPGVGPYTAAAVLNFAYNIPTPMVETNIRTVYLYHFFPKDSSVADELLWPLVKNTMDSKWPREWFWALMDYGTFLKQTHGNNVQRSKHHQRQSRFVGSDREIRGAIIRQLSLGPHTRNQLAAALQAVLKEVTEDRMHYQLDRLNAEGLVTNEAGLCRLPT